ncbi:MAG: hypothetical protein HUJ79_06640 [Firmicutes bacterium]|nr:hypothetical protein [Bacillota bacterium]
MSNGITAVTGYMGAPVYEYAKALAAERGVALVCLDREIEEREKWSIKRLVMMHGEHGYRNQEYEVLCDLAKASEPVVVACGDGVLYDDDSAAIIAEGELIIVGEDLLANGPGTFNTDVLWESASAIDDSYHAFMSIPDEAKRRQAFDEFIARQKVLFESRK